MSILVHQYAGDMRVWQPFGYIQMPDIAIDALRFKTWRQKAQYYGKTDKWAVFTHFKCVMNDFEQIYELFRTSRQVG